MAVVNLYLNFNGNCEAAFNYYKSVFGGEFTYIGKFKEMPPRKECLLCRKKWESKLCMFHCQSVKKLR